MDPAKLKVVELRAELSQRGLDTKGNKAALVERLRQALEDERTGQPEGVVHNVSDSSEEESGTSRAQEAALPARTPSRATRTAAAIATAVVAPKTPTRSTMRSARQSAMKSQTCEEGSKSNSEDDEPLAKMSKIEEKPEVQKEPEVQQPSIPVQSPVKVAQQSPVRPHESPMKPQPSVQQSPDKLDDEAEEAPTESLVKPVEKPTKEPEKCTIEAERSPLTARQQSPMKPAVQSPKQEKPLEEKAARNLTEAFKAELTQVTPAPVSPVKESVQVEAPKTPEVQKVASPVKDASPKKVEASPKKVETSLLNQVEASPSPNKIEAEPKKEENNSEVEEKMEVDQEKDSAQAEDGAKQTQEQDVDGKVAKDETQNQDNSSQDRKRKRSLSPQEDVASRPKPDDEPEFDDNNVMLSWYDSDLNLQINQENFTSATPMHKDGFGLVWAGARASYGFNSGKIYYEAKIVEKCSIDIQDEASPHILRVGWSVAGTSMQLGEEKFSYGYDGTGKKTTECNFMDYGVEFGAGDVVVSYLDMSDEKIVKMSYAVNSKDLGVAFEVNKQELGENALFPHVLTKNCIFACNFGQEDRWSETILDGYTPAAKVESKDRIAGPKRPTAKEECEMIMMCGLPGSGKTFWCTKYASEHPDKVYNILGTSSLINKMKVMGLPRKENYQGRWDTLLSMCTRALNTLVEKAYTRRRNYILDHHNVYPSAQKRKMRNFDGFSRRAVIIVPTDVEYKARRTQREQTEGKEVPDSTVLEMKASFAAPEVGELLSSVEWAELNEEEAKKVIEQYNKEGKAAGYGQQQHQNKRARVELKDGRDNRFNNRDHRRGGGGYQDRRNAGWRGGGNNGGWRDNRAPGRGGHMRPHGSYGGPGGWRPRGPPPLVHRAGGERRGAGADRRQGNDRSRQPPARQGAWGQSGYQGQQQGNWNQQGSWSGSQSQGWNQSGGWGNNQQWNWQKYGQGNYGSGYNQGYDNGNYGGWNQQQYYNQYWDQPQHSGQMAAGSQAVNAASSVTYDYSEDCHDYTQT